MSKRYFLTREAAERHLEWRVKLAKKKLRDKGETIVGDNSMVYCAPLYKWEKSTFMGIPSMYAPKPEKVVWYTLLGIMTQSYLDDMERFINIDVVAELEKVLVKELKPEIKRDILDKFKYKDGEGNNNTYKG